MQVIRARSWGRWSRQLGKRQMESEKAKATWLLPVLTPVRNLDSSVMVYDTPPFELLLRLDRSINMCVELLCRVDDE
jgi:hypothetical protein